MPNLDSPFYRALADALGDRSLTIDEICPADDNVARRVLHDYGAMFVGSKDILPPPLCVFTSEEDVATFQRRAGKSSAKIGNDTIELQPAAMKGLLKARAAARREGLDISPRLRRHREIVEIPVPPRVGPLAGTRQIDRRTDSTFAAIADCRASFGSPRTGEGWNIF